MVELSSGIPTRGGLSALARIVSRRSEPRVFVSIEYTTNDLDGTDETKTEYTESVWLYRDQIRLVQEIVGEREVGGIAAITSSPTQIEMDDRLVYGGTEYDVVNVHPLPSSDPSMHLIDLDRRQNAE